MKIGYLTYNLNPKNGWGRYSSELVNGIQAQGHQPIVLTEVADGLSEHVVLRRGLRIFQCLPAVRKLIADCDIIHALDGYPYAIIAVLASIGLRKKVVITAVGTYAVAPLYDPKWSLLLRAAYRKAKAIVAISNFTKQEILNKINLDTVQVITPGIDFQAFHKVHEEANDKFILSVGALKHRKGYHISIPAFAAAKKTVPGLRYKIVGDQSNQGYFKLLKDLVRQHGVEDDVEFIQNISDRDLRDLYRKAALFLLTPVNNRHHFEGFGLVFLEAAAAGLPVIGTFGNGADDAIGENGILVCQNDDKGTAEAIISIMSQPDLQQKMSATGYEWARQHSVADMLSQYSSVYKKILK